MFMINYRTFATLPWVIAILKFNKCRYDVKLAKMRTLTKMRIKKQKLIVILFVTILTAFIPLAAAAPLGTTESTIIEDAKSWMGAKSVSGGNNTSGIDCSHLVFQVYDQAGAKNIVFQTVPNMKKNAYYVNITSPTPGDVIFWEKDVTKNNKTYWLADHVGIYMGNEQFIDTSFDTKVVTIENITGVYKDGMPYYARWEPEGNDSNLLVATFFASPTAGNVPLSVSFTDNSIGATSWSWIFGDGNISTEQNPTHIYSVVGTYTVNLTVSNANGTSLKTATITVQSQSSSSDSSNGNGSSSDVSSSGSGIDVSNIDVSSSSDSSSSDSSSSSSGGSGGGGAGGSPESQSNVEAKEISQTFIGNGNSVGFDFPQNATPIMNISFDSKKTAGKTTTIVEMLINQSTLVSEPPADEVYKFINIWIGSSGFATPENIENAVVHFKVEKSWIQDKDMDKSSITLNRYNDTKWNSLPTNLSGGDDKYLYFTAQTPGFSSTFAITGKIAANGVLNETQSGNQSGPNIRSLENNTSNATNGEQMPEQTQSPNTSDNGGKKSPGFDAVLGIIGLLVVFIYKRK
jgi:PGF-pre-PGF domain-containing protein